MNRDSQDKPKFEKLRGGLFPQYKLLESYRFAFYHKGHLAYFIIPKGFEIDGATFGSFLFWRKSMHESPYTWAHDWIYATLGKVQARYHDDDYIPFDLTKDEGDDIFLQGARRYHNVQDWRTVIASGVFHSFAHIPWQLRKFGLIK